MENSQKRSKNFSLKDKILPILLRDITKEIGNAEDMKTRLIASVFGILQGCPAGVDIRTRGASR